MKSQKQLNQTNTSKNLCGCINNFCKSGFEPYVFHLINFRMTTLTDIIRKEQEVLKDGGEEEQH